MNHLTTSIVQSSVPDVTTTCSCAYGLQRQASLFKSSNRLPPRRRRESAPWPAMSPVFVCLQTLIRPSVTWSRNRLSFDQWILRHVLKFQSRRAKHHAKRVRRWRHTNTAYAPSNIQPTVPYGGGSFIVWGCISHDYKLNLVTIQGNLTGDQYIRDVLQPVVGLPTVDVEWLSLT
jgi:hypothetical protein